MGISAVCMGKLDEKIKAFLHMIESDGGEGYLCSNFYKILGWEQYVYYREWCAFIHAKYNNKWIDPEACFKCFAEIQKKIKVRGHLYIAVPVGKERIEFNAHRVFYVETIVREFDQVKLLEYSCTADGKIEYNVDIHKYDWDKHNGNYRYGLFHFIK